MLWCANIAFFNVVADQIYNIEKSSQSQITENKIEKLISSQKADIRTGKVKIENKKLESISLPRANYGTINQAATTLKKAMLAHQSTFFVRFQTLQGGKIVFICAFSQVFEMFLLIFVFM